ncbi:3-phosphoshikimate 1-carboxyvinyltransferase [Sedimentisphaera cyanobacteriorum]|uniref:3-phosphoshikimate 1-carboxyvinyltransferase n=1 Tax=Sedimentisphaera cyanobacteriorum TaxID=1940790 RepID=A0A1Q2HPL5_9BACT|nr:3-phosphoshikimate 1-carboxyvinyltransferase [Sedimentisphaera cyanobacteriorum]AQQ09368.1 3-phosphoshikimate 1-carboxyvinyltransferase [Sedimentisphaera cyanobacteriorum]
MIIKASGSRLSGSVKIPGSKSHTIRAAAIAGFAKGESLIRSPLLSSDTLSALKAFEAMGVKIERGSHDVWKISGVAGSPSVPNGEIDVGNSGTTLRLAIGLAALTKGSRPVRFTGDRQICSRPVQPLLDSLSDLGAEAVSVNSDGFPPVEIKGTLKGGRTSIECRTSQYLSSLFLCCPLAERRSEIEVPLLYEPDYVGITLDWLDKQNIKYSCEEDFSNVRIEGGQSYKNFDETVPADFSSASFFLCAAALCGEDVVIEGLDYSDSQPDKAVADYLRQMGADIEIFEDGTTAVKASSLKGIDIDMNRTPDALPIMAVTAALSEGTTRLYNVAQARNKETDRIKCMAEVLGKIGADIAELPDGLIIKGGSKLFSGEVSGYYDHRIIMSMAVAAIAGGIELSISAAEAVDVTFPTFPELMSSIGGRLERIEDD